MTSRRAALATLLIERNNLRTREQEIYVEMENVGNEGAMAWLTGFVADTIDQLLEERWNNLRRQIELVDEIQGLGNLIALETDRKSDIGGIERRAP